MGGKAKARKADRKREKKAAKEAKLTAKRHPPGRESGLLPASLAGVNVPQALRQSGSALVEFATSDLGRAVLVAALTGAADAILRHRSGGDGEADKGGSLTAKEVVQSAALAAAGAMKDAAKTVLPPALMGEAPPKETKGAKGARGAGEAEETEPPEEAERGGAARA